MYSRTKALGNSGESAVRSLFEDEFVVHPTTESDVFGFDCYLSRDEENEIHHVSMNIVPFDDYRVQVKSTTDMARFTPRPNLSSLKHLVQLKNPAFIVSVLKPHKKVERIGIFYLGKELIELIMRDITRTIAGGSRLNEKELTLPAHLGRYFDEHEIYDPQFLFEPILRELASDFGHPYGENKIFFANNVGYEGNFGAVKVPKDLLTDLQNFQQIELPLDHVTGWRKRFGLELAEDRSTVTNVTLKRAPLATRFRIQTARADITVDEAEFIRVRIGDEFRDQVSSSIVTLTFSDSKFSIQFSKDPVLSLNRTLQIQRVKRALMSDGCEVTYTVLDREQIIDVPPASDIERWINVMQEKFALLLATAAAVHLPGVDLPVDIETFERAYWWKAHNAITCLDYPPECAVPGELPTAVGDLAYLIMLLPVGKFLYAAAFEYVIEQIQLAGSFKKPVIRLNSPAPVFDYLSSNVQEVLAFVDRFSRGKTILYVPEDSE